MLQFYPRVPRCPAQSWYKFQFWTPPRHTHYYLYSLVLALPVGHRVSQLSPKSWAKYWCVQSERSHPRTRVAAANGLVWECKKQTVLDSIPLISQSTHTPTKTLPRKEYLRWKQQFHSCKLLWIDTFLEPAPSCSESSSCACILQSDILSEYLIYFTAMLTSLDNMRP